MRQPPAVLPAYAKGGYAAITSVIVILAVIVVVGIATSILSIGNAQMSLGQSKSEETLSLVESCIEDTLLTYNQLGSLPSSRTTPLGTCTITVISQDSSSATFTTTGSIGPYTKNITVTADRQSNVTVVNWRQTN